MKYAQVLIHASQRMTKETCIRFSKLMFKVPCSASDLNCTYVLALPCSLDFVLVVSTLYLQSMQWCLPARSVILCVDESSCSLSPSIFPKCRDQNSHHTSVLVPKSDTFSNLQFCFAALICFLTGAFPWSTAIDTPHSQSLGMQPYLGPGTLSLHNTRL